MVKQMQFDEKTATASGRDQRWEAVKQLRGQSSPWKQPGNHMETAVQSNHGREVTWSNHSRTWVDTIMCKSASMNANNEYGKDASWHRICSSLAEPFFQQEIYMSSLFSTWTVQHGQQVLVTIPAARASEAAANIRPEKESSCHGIGRKNLQEPPIIRQVTLTWFTVLFPLD